ncbi:MAG TPA: ATP-binding protein [Desulfomonilaceae bacterium]|nr:ATP-binding protein [Desulfomonilaceae bacterium]
MRDEEKSREQLLEELQALRGRLQGPREISESTESWGDALSSELPDSEELEWDPDYCDMPAPDKNEDAETDPHFLIAPGGIRASQDYPGRNVTETGSFDMRWISLASFGRLLHAIPIPMLLIADSGKIQFANNAFLKLTQSGSVDADSFYSLCPEEEIPHIRVLVENAVRHRHAQFREGKLTVQNREIWSRMNFRSIRFGKDRSILVPIEDLTAEKRELSLNAKYKSLVDIFPIGIAEFTFPKQVCRDSCTDELLSEVLSARMVDGNTQFAKLHGYEKLHDLVGKPFGGILPPDETSYRTWVENEFSLFPFEVKQLGIQGQCNFFEYTLVGNVHDGTIGHFWVMKQDITERKRVQEELVEKLRTIDELYEHIVQSGKAKAIAEHTAKVAHELRQPLTIIGGFARRIARESSSCEKRNHDANSENFGIIINEVQRLENILGSLIDFSRHEAVTLRRLNPNEMIQYVLKINRDRVKEKNLRVDLNLDDNMKEIPVDAERFQQVIRNLIANAIEASPPYSHVMIKTGMSTPGEKAHKTGELTAESYFEMKIQNQGKIIPPEDLAKIFDPFFTTKNYGTGLGLTLSKKIVEDHLGSISVKSDAQGTLFTVWLPLNRPAENLKSLH